jgi:hypothetical protein
VAELALTHDQRHAFTRHLGRGWDHRLAALRPGARALGQDDKLHTNQTEADEAAPLVRVKTSSIAVRH